MKSRKKYKVKFSCPRQKSISRNKYVAEDSTILAIFAKGNFMQDELGAGAGQGYLLYSRTPASERLDIQVYARGKIIRQS